MFSLEILQLLIALSTASIQKCLTLEDGGKFTYVFNLAAETKYGQTEEVCCCYFLGIIVLIHLQVYNEKVFDLSVKCATEAAKAGVERFIEVSTAQVYSPGSVIIIAFSMCNSPPSNLVSLLFFLGAILFYLETLERRRQACSLDQHRQVQAEGRGAAEDDSRSEARHPPSGARLRPRR